MQGQAESAITSIFGDFPKQKIEKLGLSAIHPDAFLPDMFELNAAALQAEQKQRGAMRNPAMASGEYRDCLQRQTLPNLVS